MARKQALRELQTRLAERMLAARTQVRGRAWLAVECAGRGFLIPLQQAGEIFAAVSLVALPYAQPWCLGVANLRGQLHTVVDLGAFLGLSGAGSSMGSGTGTDTSGAAARPQTAAAREQAQLLAFSPTLDINAALWVDRLAGLRNEAQMTPLADDADAAPPTHPMQRTHARPAFAEARQRDTEGRVWQTLNLAALARHDAFLTVNAGLGTAA